jgi:hypothetical protein
MSDTPDDLLAKLRERVLPADGGTADSWKHHWNLTPLDSQLHRDAADRIESLERERDALQRVVDEWLRVEDAMEELRKRPSMAGVWIVPNPLGLRLQDVKNAARRLATKPNEKASNG